MKICPQCQNRYTDDSLQFCLQDGSPLVGEQETTDWTESETIVSPHRRSEQIQIPQSSSPTQDLQSGRVSEISTINQPPKKSNKFQILILAALALSVFLGLVGFGTWVLVRNMQNEVANKNNKALTNSTTPTNSKQNINISNANKLTNITIPTATPTPKPTLNSTDESAAKSDIADVINSWKGASERLDLNSHLSYYADTVDYYRAGNVNVSKIRADKQKAYDMYHTINIDISNVKTAVDPSGEKATSVFDKEWLFENDQKTNSGKVQQQLQLAKIGGKWRITGEKELKVYYVNK